MNFGERKKKNNMTIDIWTAVGLVGGGIFVLANIIQWVASEKAGKSVLPKMFWQLRILGAFILVTYAIHQQDPVFIPFQAAATIIAIFGALRNLHLMKKM